MSVCFYSPDGTHQVFEDGTPCPKGWADRPFKSDRHNKLADAVEAITDAAEQIAKWDHDGDGRIGGSLPKAKRKVKRNGLDSK